jgi:hypothetical protein
LKGQIEKEMQSPLFFLLQATENWIVEEVQSRGSCHHIGWLTPSSLKLYEMCHK